VIAPWHRPFGARTGVARRTPTRAGVRDALLGGSCLRCLITEVNCTIAKAAFLQKLELQSHVVRQG
jgi:hypothetical protein